MLDLDREWPSPGPRPGWARAAGITPVSVGSAELPADRAVDAVLSAYCSALDERDEELLGECLAANAVWRARLEQERELPRIDGRGAILRAHVAAWAAGLGQLRHFLLGTRCTSTGEEHAVALSRMLVTRADVGGVAIVATGVHRAALTRPEEGWRLSRVEAGFDVDRRGWRWPGT
jgi:ketosteroid isomerase-like protein